MSGSDGEGMLHAEYERDEILSTFSRLLKVRQTVRLHNLVQGVPVSFDAYVKMVRSDQVVQFAVHRYQARAMELEKHAVVVAEPFGKPVGAILHSLDFPARIACLHRFCYLDHCAVQRRFYRVPVDANLPVAMVIPERRSIGCIRDVSINGMAALFKKGHDLKPGDLPVVAFRLFPADDGNGPVLKMKARVVRVASLERCDLVAVQLAPPKAERDQMARFVSERQKQILKAFKAGVDEMESKGYECVQPGSSVAGRNGSKDYLNA